MKKWNFITILFLLIVSCNNSNSVVGIQVYGALFKIMHEGQREGVVRLQDVLQNAHTYGLGTMEGLNGELIIMDNEVLITKAENGGIPTSRNQITTDDEALLLVTAQVENWQSVQINKSVTMESIDGVIKKSAEEMRVNTDQPFPFIIEGELDMVNWHIIDSPEPGGSHDEHIASSWKRIDSDINGKILGFYSEHHRTIFTHYYSFSHMHVIFENDLLSGHVDDIAIRSSWTLSVPQLNKL